MIPSTGYSTPLLETLISFIFGAFKIGCSWNFLAGFPAKWPWCRSVWWPQKEVAMATVRWERDAGVLAEHLGCSSILVAMNLVLCYTCANMFTSFFLQGIWGGPWMWISMISHDGGYQLQSTIWPLREQRVLQWNQDSSVGLWLQWLCLVYLQHLTTIVLGIHQLIIMVYSSDYGL